MDNQYGFVPGRSTEDAINQVLEVAENAATGPSHRKNLCALVTLDVRNAFNTAPWVGIDQALRNKDIPLYLLRMLRSYLQGRVLLVGPQKTPRKVKCGVPQGSVLGPALWNVYYDGLLGLQLPPSVKLIAFADDVALVATARTGEDLEELLNPALARVSGWMQASGLQLAPRKSEAIMLTRKWAQKHTRDSGGWSVRYLGVELDRG